MNVEDYSRIVSSIEEDIRSLGKIIADLSGCVSHSKKLHAYDLLTDIDAKVENKLKEKLAVIDPSTPVVGEETGGDRAARRYWLIDPIDGTIHFVRGTPFCTIMMALIEDGIPTVGIIYNVATGDFYSAIKGQGSYKNGTRIKTSDRKVAEAVVLTEINLNTQENVKKFRNLATSVKLMNLVCAGYEFAMVADGRAEARICIDPFGDDYDFAAGSILVQEAGGVVKTFKKQDYDVSQKDFIVASSEEMYHNMLGIINGEVMPE